MMFYVAAARSFVSPCLQGHKCGYRCFDKERFFGPSMGCRRRCGVRDPSAFFLLTATFLHQRHRNPTSREVAIDLHSLDKNLLNSGFTIHFLIRIFLPNC